MKKFTLLRSNHRGFALIATILLMVLLAIITVGTLSLSVVTLRSEGQESARNIARANARMALMIAIGELQRHTGSDTRVTAPANIVDASYPQVLGVWKSWEGTDHEVTGRDPNPVAPGRPKIPQYSAKDVREEPGNTGRFVDWLVSTAATKTKPNITDPPSLVLTTASVDTIPLLSEGSLMPTDTRQVHVVPSKLENRGRFAWWVSGENQKALLAQPYEPRNADESALVEIGQSHTISDPSVFGLTSLINDPELYNPDTAPAKSARKAISRQTMALIDTDNATKPDKKFHDLSTYSIGLLTNTATGGWRKDLSLLAERWDAIYASTPGGQLPLFRYTPTAGTPATSQVPKPVKPAAALVMNNTGASATALTAATPNESNLYPWSNYSIILPGNANKQPSTYQAASASWQSLVSYATSYKNFSVDSGVVESPFAWDVLTGDVATWAVADNCKVINIYNYKHVQRLHPQIARFQVLIYARAVPIIPAANPPRYDLRLMFVPIITLWNPYNVGLTIGPLNSSINEELLVSWRRSMPINLAVVNQATGPWFTNPALVPNSQYRYLSHGNLQYVDVAGNWGGSQDQFLAANTAKGYGAQWLDLRAFGASLPPGKITFKPGETKVYSPRLPGHVHWSGSIRLGEGFNQNNILGFEFTGAGSLLASARYWFLMKNDRVTRPYKGRNPGIGFDMTFGKSRGPFYQSHPSHNAVNEPYQYLSMLAPEDVGSKYWPPTDVDEVGYSIAELANGPWVPIFTVSMGPRTTIGNAPGTEQNRPTKGVIQSNPLASISMVDPVSGNITAHPANGTFDISYHSMSANSTLTPNLSTSKGFIATGYQSGDGLSRLVMADIPLRPMASLVELQGWNPRGNNPYPPFQHNLIGNSDATPLIANDKIIPATMDPNTVSTNLMHDDAYCANHLLFDDWFVSSIAPQPVSFGGAISKDINTFYQDYLKGYEKLTNRAYRKIQADSNLTPAQVTTLSTEIINTNPKTGTNDGWLKVASRLEVEGMFNVNTTSVEAWKALLGRAKSLEQIAIQGANKIEAGAVDKKHIVTRGPIASDVEAGSGAGYGGQFANASEYTGYRSLSDEQINDLAEKVVEQVRLRGPFLSLSEFINRQLSSNDDLALAGTIQTAINNLDTDPMAELRDPTNSLSDNTMSPNDQKVTGSGYTFPKASAGSSAYGAPSWIRQADILRPIAPILSVRDDTFTIRAYGDALDKDGKVIAQAWCEAIVKRTREFCDKSDAADSIDPPTNQRNITFGRYYDIVSFRWLNANEV
jgi:type II secretory pathway pseudopilin PulG